MQTFLPYPSYIRSARVLDRQRLGKQRVEVKQILSALRKPHYGWKNHPAVRMWMGYEYALVSYGVEMCDEWIKRGYKDSLLDEFREIRLQIHNEILLRDKTLIFYPKWLNDKRLTRSHQSNLIRKDPDYYRDLFPGVPDNIPYWWPEAKDPNGGWNGRLYEDVFAA
jgi:hypothetical protein